MLTLLPPAFTTEKCKYCKKGAVMGEGGRIGEWVCPVCGKRTEKKHLPVGCCSWLEKLQNQEGNDMKRNVVKELKVSALVIAGAVCICACGGQESSAPPDSEAAAVGILDDTPSKTTEEETWDVLGEDCFLDDFSKESAGKKFIFTGTFWSTRKDDYGYSFSYKEHNKNGTITRREFFVKDDTEDQVLAALEDMSYEDRTAVKMYAVYDKTVVMQFEGSESEQVVCYATVKDAEILNPDSQEAKQAVGNYYSVGDAIQYTNGQKITIISTGKHTDRSNTYAYVEVDVENRGESNITLGNYEGVFYGDDYLLTPGCPADSVDELLSGAVIAPGRKNHGKMYAKCPNYDSLTRIEMELDDCVIVVKDDFAEGQTENTNEDILQPVEKNINYSMAYDYAFGEVNDSIEYGSYCLWDLDGNGVYELILGHGESSADYVNEIWTVSEESGLTGVGSIYGEQSFYMAPDGNGLYAVYGNMGYEAITRITMADGKLVEELVSERELGPDEDYYSSEMVISSRDISDRSLLEQY